jgi:transcription-repair coupling factor (superfamily II helicase)
MGEADSEPSKKDDDNSPPWDTDDEEKSQFKKPNNPNRTGQDSARALAQRGMQSKMNVQELAEFISSFYDRNSGTFPKGPEGVVIMVGKKFGEQAEQVARKMVERMAPQQQDPQIAELARIRELAGY